MQAKYALRYHESCRDNKCVIKCHNLLITHGISGFKVIPGDYLALLSAHRSILSTFQTDKMKFYLILFELPK